MVFIAAKCTQCGANIKVDESKDAGICSHCNTAFVVEKAINNYNSNITNHNNYAGATIVGDNELKKWLEAATGFEKLEEHSAARYTYKKIMEGYPREFMGWWGYTLAEINLRKERFKTLNLEDIYFKITRDYPKDSGGLWSYQLTDRYNLRKESWTLSLEDIEKSFDHRSVENARKLADKKQLINIDKELEEFKVFVENLILMKEEEINNSEPVNLREDKKRVSKLLPSFNNLISRFIAFDGCLSGRYEHKQNSNDHSFEIRYDKEDMNVYMSYLEGNEEDKKGITEYRCTVTGWDDDYTLTKSSIVEVYHVTNKNNKNNKNNTVWIAKYKGCVEIDNCELGKSFTIINHLNRFLIRTSDNNYIWMHETEDASYSPFYMRRYEKS